MSNPSLKCPLESELSTGNVRETSLSLSQHFDMYWDDTAFAYKPADSDAWQAQSEKDSRLSEMPLMQSRLQVMARLEKGRFQSR